jgi:hypothetical protein
MRTVAAWLCSVLLMSAFAGCFGDDEKESEPEPLRLNHLTMKGTHNSYHERNPGAALIDEMDYDHATLDVQADRLGVRQFELDVWYIPGVGFRVYHSPIDPASTCPNLAECLGVLLDWSEGNPDHAPLWIFIEPKDLPLVVEEGDLLELLQADLEANWPANRTITPADVQGEAETLREAVTEDGWPTLEASRGKALFVLLDKTEIRDLYVERNPTLSDQWMFAIVDEAEPLASVISFVNPTTQQERLKAAAEAGFMVRTRPDSATVEAREENYTRFELALSSGAHFITTDFPGNDREMAYAIWLPEGPVMCNSNTAPDHCTTRAIEPWGNYTPLPTG